MTTTERGLTPGLSPADLETHIRAALTRATLETRPAAHALVDQLLPAEVYSLLLDAIPPAGDFDYADKVKQNFDPSTSTRAPEASLRVWRWFERDVVDGLIGPLVLEWFHPHVRAWYRELFGPALADAALGLRQHAFRSRLMLRRPGYRLKPHRDTKIATITGLIYFARPGDSREYGTELYQVEGDRLAPSMKTFYPEAHGGRCTLVRTVPFVGNSALFFLNAVGMAHGAQMPPESPQAERYAYQFYLGPPEADLGALVSRMPPEQRSEWSGVAVPPASDS